MHAFKYQVLNSGPIGHIVPARQESKAKMGSSCSDGALQVVKSVKALLLCFCGAVTGRWVSGAEKVLKGGSIGNLRIRGNNAAEGVKAIKGFFEPPRVRVFLYEQRGITNH